MRIGRVALDGSKVKANASKHKAMSYGRMGEKLQHLRDEVKQLLVQADATDAAEDTAFMSDPKRTSRGRTARRRPS